MKNPVQQVIDRLPRNFPQHPAGEEVEREEIRKFLDQGMTVDEIVQYKRCMEEYGSDGGLGEEHCLQKMAELMERPAQRAEKERKTIGGKGSDYAYSVPAQIGVMAGDWSPVAGKIVVGGIFAGFEIALTNEQATKLAYMILAAAVGDTGLRFEDNAADRLFRREP